MSVDKVYARAIEDKRYTKEKLKSKKPKREKGVMEALDNFKKIKKQKGVMFNGD